MNHDDIPCSTTLAVVGSGFFDGSTIMTINGDDTVSVHVPWHARSPRFGL